ncbi:MAG: Ig-like domain-containing protein, partial [Gammaproteobacteria bacterium]|nr:Ig-like domain-containing protein [Gammaproteobacteria bacterium]
MKSLSLIVIIISLVACGGGGSGGASNDSGSTSSANSGTISPGGGATLNALSPLVVTFNGSMDPDSTALGGTLANDNVSLAWSSETTSNDTLTITPAKTWSDGKGKTLTVDADNVQGSPVEQVSVTYDIDAVTPTGSISPDISVISRSQQITILFSESMNTSSLALAGSMASESDGGVWTTTTNQNDTLTLSPDTNWTGGSGKTLDISVMDKAGNPLLSTMKLAYSVASSDVSVVMTPPNGSVISRNQSIVLVFSASMNIESLTLGGNLASESDGGVWSATTHANDTLTISPSSQWTTGAHIGNTNAEISVYINDGIGEPLAVQQRDYDVDVISVSTLGDNNNEGSMSAPKLNIQAGLKAAQSLGVTNVHVQVGTYDEVLELVEGVTLKGGFDSSWVYSDELTDEEHKVSINGSLHEGDGEYMAIRVRDVSQPTILSTLVINGPDITGTGNTGMPGLSSYAIHAVNTEGLLLKKLKINGGQAQHSGNGVNGINDSSQAENGNPGISAKEHLSLCDDTTRRGSGVAGGAGALRGGHGGLGGKIDTSCSGFPFTHNETASPGLTGLNAATVHVSGNYGFGGDGGAGSTVCGDGQPGNPGLDGREGDAGTGGSAGGVI